MSIFNARRVGYVICMGALLAAGLSTGTRLYYLVFFMLLMMVALSLISAAWTLWLPVPVTLKRFAAALLVFIFGISSSS